MSRFVAAAAIVALGVVSVAYVAFPSTRTVTVVKHPQLPPRPTLAQIKRELENVQTVQEDYLMSPDGRPFYCAVSDSTFSPTSTKGIRWQVRWCWELTRAEVEALAKQPAG